MAALLPASARSAPGEEPYVQLQRLVETAPARQVGQAGNAEVDRWVAELFEGAAALYNADPGADDLAAAEAALEAAQRLHAEHLEVQSDRESLTQGEQVVRSPWYVRWTIEEPIATSVCLVILGLLFVVGWQVRHRRSHLVVAVAAVAMAIGLPIAAHFIDSAAEGTSGGTRAGRSAQQLEAGVLDAANRALAAEIEAAKRLEGRALTGRLHFPSAAFEAGDAELTLADETSGAAAPLRLYALEPNLVDPGNLQDGRFEGPVVYAGRAVPDDLDGKTFDGAAAVLEYDCGKRWLEVMTLGARIVIFLEPPAPHRASFAESARKRTETPLSIPRFYVRREAFEQRFGAVDDEAGPLSRTPTVRIVQPKPGTWHATELAVDWLFLPGTEAPRDDGAPFEKDPGRQLIHLQFYKDSRSIVPTLSPGARSGGNLVLMQRLVERFVRERPSRPVLFSAVNDHSNGLNGEQHYGYMAFAAPAALRPELAFLEEDLARHQLIERTFGAPPDGAAIERIRVGTASAAGRIMKLREPAQNLLTHERNVLRARRDALQSRLAIGAPATDRDHLSRQILEIDREAQSVIRVMRLFNRFGSKTYFDEASATRAGSEDVLEPRERQRVVELFAEITNRARRDKKVFTTARGQLLQNLALRRRLRRFTEAARDDAPARSIAAAFDRRHPRVPAVAALTFDLSFGTDAVGFFHSGHFGGDPGSNTSQKRRTRIARLAKLTVQLAAELSEPTGSVRFVDTLRNVGGISMHAHLGRHVALAARTMHPHNVAGLTLANVRDFRDLAYSPHDTVDRIDRNRFNDTVEYAERMVVGIVDAEALGLTRQTVGKADAKSTWIDVRMLDRFSAGVSERRLPGALVVAQGPPGGLLPTVSMLGQVSPLLTLKADSVGQVLVRGDLWGGLTAYGIDGQGRLNAALDMVLGETQFKSSIDIPDPISFKRKSIVAFEARKIDLIGLSEPLTMAPPYSAEPIDAGSESPPRHYAVNGLMAKASRAASKQTPTTWDGTGSVWVEPHTRIKLLIGRGLAINASDDAPAGTGFGPETPLLLDPVRQSANDIWIINDQRISLLRSKGISDEAAWSLSESAEEMLAASRAATAGRDPNAARVAAERAQGMGYRSYQRGLSTINDLIRAVILFLMLVIPFCYFLMKLVSPYTGVNRQLALFGIIFVLTAVMLHLVHPAFAVSQTPTMVLLAFAILGLSGFVAVVLVSRFNESMNQAVEQMQQSESSEPPRSRLAAVAFVVGVNNMKRRRIRTTLTCVTIVLVTFTMLSVISVGQDVAPMRRSIGGSAPYNGWVFTTPGSLTLSELQVQRLRNQFGRTSRSVVRAWCENKGPYGVYFSFAARPEPAVPGAPEAALQFKVLLGLEPAEHGFIAPMPLLPGGRWFSADHAEEIVISVRAARYLGIAPDRIADHRIEIGGRSLRLVGLLDDERVEAMRDLGDLPLLPNLIQAGFVIPTTDPTEQNVSLASGAARLDTADSNAQGMRMAEAKDVAFLPRRLALETGYGGDRSVSFRYDPAPGEHEDDAARRAWDDAELMITFQHARIALGLNRPVTFEDQGRSIEPGQYALASSSSTEVVGVLKIMIPIILVATIILNTMLGSVMERRREVGIYNAIGLNPGHVMMFFLAESLVFGVVGSVAGYLIGQGLSLVLSQLIDLNLNYSSMSVMVVIFLSIGTVLLSTIYPAIMAARAAVPSGQRRWSLPQPEGNEIHVKFPFSYDDRRLRGVCAYIDDFMKQNTEASTGRFLARPDTIGRVPAAVEDGDDSDAPPSYVLIYDIAPAPFDLGVNQKMEVYAFFDPHVRAHMVSVHLTRLSGQLQNWTYVNQPFLEALRKRLLEWRSQRQEVQDTFCERGRTLLADLPQLPVRTG